MYSLTVAVHVVKVRYRFTPQLVYIHTHIFIYHIYIDLHRISCTYIYIFNHDVVAGREWGVDFIHQTNTSIFYMYIYIGVNNTP